MGDLLTHLHSPWQLPAEMLGAQQQGWAAAWMQAGEPCGLLQCDLGCNSKPSVLLCSGLWLWHGSGRVRFPGSCSTAGTLQ